MLKRRSKRRMYPYLWCRDNEVGKYPILTNFMSNSKYLVLKQFNVLRISFYFVYFCMTNSGDQKGDHKSRNIVSSMRRKLEES